VPVFKLGDATILPYLLVAVVPILIWIMDIPVGSFYGIRQHGNSRSRNLMQLTQGSVVELDRFLLGEPLDVLSKW